MAKVNREEWYRRVNEVWKDKLDKIPELTAPEAVRAGKKIYRFLFGRPFKGEVRITSGNRYTWIRRGVMSINLNGESRDGTKLPGRGGWNELVHLLSHYAHLKLYPGKQPHHPTHARMEMRVRKEALKRGWLDGSLRSAAKQKVEVSADEQKQKRVKHLQDLKRKWETKKKRAETAIKKLSRKIAAQERAVQKARGPNVQQDSVGLCEETWDKRETM